MQQRFYGVFNVCYDTYTKDDFQHKKTWITVRAIQKPHDVWNDKAGKVYADRSCNEIKTVLMSSRQTYEYDRKFSRSHRFRTKFFIHECDKDGWWVASKKEVEEAKALIEENKARQAIAEEAPLKL